MDDEWIDKSLHPQLDLECEGFRFQYRPVSVVGGPSASRIVDFRPADVAFEVECSIPHSPSGSLVYTSGPSLYFDSARFLEFARGIRAVLEETSESSSLGPYGEEFMLTILRVPKLRMAISIKEYQHLGEPDVSASASQTIGDMALVYRWIDEIKAFSQHLDNWVLMNR